MKKILLFVVIFMFAGCDVDPDMVKNFVIFGQSNAKGDLALAIERESKDLIDCKNHRHPGDPIATWIDDGIPGVNIEEDWQFLIERGVEFDGILWFQGESDRSIPELYREDFDDWRDYWREKLGPDLVIIILKVYTLDGSCEDIREVQQQIAADYEDVYIVDTKNYERYDNFHLTTDGFNELAKTIVSGLKNIYYY